ncbi:LysM peptidoglycan-binding domain-containing protein, partial [Allorhizocola rhizosphaerae]|uniref:LysM peptidoglycan-binding domain-containing protein n=1 Tax=Allorhizocola rhizosphaerae TaxID=1872709 RepID=UPI000E3EC291
MMALLSRLLVRVTAGSILLAVITAIPSWLVLAVGWPLPEQLPTLDALASWINGTVTDHMVVDGIAVAIWLVWLLFVQAVAAEVLAAIRGNRHQRRHLNPLRTVAATLVGALLLGSFLTATAAASPAPARATTPVTAANTPAAAVSVQVGAAEVRTTVLVGDTRYTYIVKRGDYLSKIAKAWLGDADRWPEICSLNKHRHFPKVGGTLRGCNIIYPGWDLKLPADARPPADAKPVQPPPPPPPPVDDPDGVIGEPTPSPSTTASPSVPASPQATASPSATVANPVVPTAPAASASPAPSATTSVTASSTPSADGSADPSASAPAADDEGVRLPDGSWVTWTLAAAITAAAALVWLQRRRRFTVEADDDDPPVELPPPVTQLRRAVAHRPELTLPADEAEQAAAVPELAALPPGGIGLLGDGAHAAARAAL